MGRNGHRRGNSLAEGLPITRVVHADQARSFDWKMRNVACIAKARDHTTEDALAKLQALLGERHSAPRHHLEERQPPGDSGSDKSAEEIDDIIVNPEHATLMLSW